MRKAQPLTMVEPAKAMSEILNSKVGKKTAGWAASFHRAVRDEHENRFGEINYISTVTGKMSELLVIWREKYCSALSSR